MSALKQVFPRVYFRYDQDRYAQDLEQFAAWLLANGYRNKTARTHLFRAQQALRAVGGPPGAALQADVLRRTFQRLRQRRWRKCTTHSTFAGYLRSVGRLADFPAPIPTRTEALLEDFLERLGRRRGLATSTICNYRIWVSDFLRRSLRRGSSIEGLSSRSVERYIQTRAPQLARVTFLTAIKCIQAFLRFCHERVALAERLDLIDLPRRFGAERPPERVERMAREMQAEYAALMGARDAHNEEGPQELRELDERITRLRKRLRDGDPDITADELQAALDRAQAKRQVLAAASHPPNFPQSCCACCPTPRAHIRSRLRRG